MWDNSRPTTPYEILQQKIADEKKRMKWNYPPFVFHLIRLDWDYLDSLGYDGIIRSQVEVVLKELDGQTKVFTSYSQATSYYTHNAKHVHGIKIDKDDVQEAYNIAFETDWEWEFA